MRRSLLEPVVAFVAFVALVPLTTACGSKPAAPAPKTAAPLVVDGAAAKKLVAGGARLVDVRTPEEFATEHLDGAVNVPIELVGTPLSDLGPKDAPLVLYCASGRRASHAAELLRTRGFTRVYELGAMTKWGQDTRAGKPLGAADSPQDAGANRPEPLAPSDAGTRETESRDSGSHD